MDLICFCSFGSQPKHVSLTSSTLPELSRIDKFKKRANCSKRMRGRGCTSFLRESQPFGTRARDVASEHFLPATPSFAQLVMPRSPRFLVFGRPSVEITGLAMLANLHGLQAGFLRAHVGGAL